MRNKHTAVQICYHYCRYWKKWKKHAKLHDYPLQNVENVQMECRESEAVSLSFISVVKRNKNQSLFVSNNTHPNGPILQLNNILSIRRSLCLISIISNASDVLLFKTHLFYKQQNAHRWKFLRQLKLIFRLYLKSVNLPCQIQPGN